MIKCPKCKSEKVAAIVYGIPADDMLDEITAGTVIFGGEGHDGGQPDFGCLMCDHRWSKETFFGKDITKLRFKIVENGPCFIEDVHRWVYEIFPSGKVVKYSYLGRSNRYIDREEQHADMKRVMEVFDTLQYLVRIRWADEVVCMVCDGCSYELQISYVDGRKEIHNGDIGGGTVDKLLMNLVEEVFMNDRTIDVAKIEDLIKWWKVFKKEHYGVDYEDFMARPLMEAFGEDVDEILDYLNSMEPEDLLMISGCFEDIYRKFMTEDVWVRLEALEIKCGMR